MHTVQVASLSSGKISGRQAFPGALALVCLWSIIGLLLTVVAHALGFGAEIAQALAVAG